MRGMVKATCVFYVLSMVLPVSWAYSTGPPVSMSGVCTDMFPTGHGYAAQTSASPFEVVTNQACYKDGLTVQVVVRTMTSSTAPIEGLFVQARNSSTNSTIGTFTVSDSVLSSITCTTANSAVGHNQVDKTYFRSMVWTPPGGLTEDITFRATVVEHTDTFWVGVESSAISYNANCVTGSTIASTRTYGSNAAAASQTVTFVVSSFLLAVLAMA